MKNLTLIYVLAGFGFAVQGQLPTAETSGIDLELARFVAGQHVERNRQPQAWRSLDAMVLHDADGKIAAFAFVFAKAEAALRTPADLQRCIQEKASRLRKLRRTAGETGSKAQDVGQTPVAMVQAEEELYGLADLATVITGATAESPLVLRHFRGLPEFWVQAETFEPAAVSGTALKNVQVVQVIMITPSDFRLALSEAGETAATRGSLRSSQAAELPDSARVFKVYGQTLASLGEVRTAQRSVEVRQEQQVSRLKAGTRERYAQALKDRGKALADTWKEQSELWRKTRSN